MVDAAVSKTVGRQLPCRFDSDLRHKCYNAGLCSGSTEDFGSSSPGSNPGPAALFPGSSMVERAAVNCKVVGSNPTRGATLESTSRNSYKSGLLQKHRAN